MSLLRNFRNGLSLDYRSLALYRFLMGIIVMADVLYRLPDLTNFYTDVGLIPRSIFVSEMAMPWSFSLHLANGSFGFAVFMFTLHFIFGMMMLLGFKTRWATIGAFIMTVSVHNRNWLVNNGGDDILRAILFISIFLPLNKFFSLDSALKKGKDLKDDAHFSSWALTIYLQVFVVYFVSYILKDHPIWRRDFTAVFFSSRLDIFATPIGIWLKNFPGFQKFSTILTIYIEWIGPLLLIFAGFFGRFWWIARLFTICLFWGLHIGIILTMWIGVFPYLCLVIWTIFLPGPFWDRFFGFFRAKNFGKLSLYYDAECGFCQKGVRIIREFFLLPDVEILEAQSIKDIHKEMVKNHSWVVVNGKGEKTFQFRAWLEIMSHSPILWPLRSLFGTKLLSQIFQSIYVWVSHHRPLMGKLTQFLTYETPKNEIKTLQWIYQILGAFFFTSILMWNLSTIKKWNIEASFFKSVIRLAHLYQEWNMFAPFPKMDNIWVEIPAVLESGKEIELLSGDSDIYSPKSEVFPSLIKNEHWRKFYLNLSDRTDYAKYYGGYLCRAWNDRGMRSVPQETLRKFEINVYSQPTNPDGSKGPINKKYSWKHWCFDQDFKQDNNNPTVP